MKWIGVRTSGSKLSSMKNEGQRINGFRCCLPECLSSLYVPRSLNYEVWFDCVIKRKTSEEIPALFEPVSTFLGGTSLH